MPFWGKFKKGRRNVQKCTKVKEGRGKVKGKIESKSVK
jgi:hypothetical protein